MGDFPMMTERGTFIINGTERVVVSQLVRSPGVYFSRELDKTTDKDVYIAKIIPSRGAWLEFDVDKKDTVGVRIDRKRRQNVTVLLKALGWSADEILALFDQAESIKNTLEKDHVETPEEALEDIYRKLRPGEPPTAESARTLLENLFFNPKRYDLARVGRYKVNKKLEAAQGVLQSQLKARAKQLARARQPRQEGVGPAEVPRLGGAPEGRAGRERAEVQGDPVLRGHAPHGPLPREAARRRGGLRARRHRPLREPAAALGGRADPEPDPDRPVAHGAGRPRADDHAGRRGDHAPDADQHPPGGREHQGVLRDLAAVAVHGPDQPARRADPQAPAVGARARWALARARGVRGPGRPPLALRPDVPDRDAGGPEHRPDRLALDLRAHQPVRVHRDPVPTGHGRQGHRQGRLPLGRRGGPARHRAGQRADQARRRLRQPDRPGPPQGRRGRLGRARRGRLHGRLAQADHLGRGGPDPVPRARRREPGPHGRQHAAPGRAPAPFGGPDRRDRRGVPRRRRRRGRGPGRGGGDRRGRLGRRHRDPRADRLDEDLQAPEVPPVQPGHVAQPEAAGQRGRQGRPQPGDRRRTVHGVGRARARSQPDRGVHAVGGPQLRGRDHHLRAAGQGRRPDLDPHRGARGRRPRHQARGRGDHPRHPQRVRGDPEGPRRARDRPDRRRGQPRRLPRRQGHAQGRDRAHPRGAAAPRDLRREGARGARHLAQGPARRERQGDRRPRVHARGRRRAAAGREPAGPRLRGAEAQDLRRRQARRPPREQGRDLDDPAGGGHAVPRRREPRRHHPEPARRAVAG